MPSHFTPPRYMTRFRCIAERCEDSCCSGLKVPVSQAHARRMHEALGAESKLTPNPGGSAPESAFIQMRPDGGCPFLDTERLCSLQRRHGDALLPDICATFPRVVTRWGERWEVAGTLACPEVARQCLLAEDSTQPEAETDPSPLIPRPDSARDLTRAPEDAYALHAEAVRNALLRWLERRAHPLASRLALLGRFAHAVDDFYFQGTEAFGDDARAEAQARLDGVLQHFDTEQTQEAIHQDFSELALPGGPCVGLFASLLKARMTLRGERFLTLARGVLTSLRLDADTPEDLDPAWRTYEARWHHVAEAHGARLEQAFHNYALHSVWRTPFTDSPSLLAYVFRLALRVGLLRLMLMGHPRLEALHREPFAPDAAESLDLAVVETFQLVARHVEQSPEFLTLAEGLLGTGRGAQTLGKVLVFAAF